MHTTYILQHTIRSGIIIQKCISRHEITKYSIVLVDRRSLNARTSTRQTDDFPPFPSLFISSSRFASHSQVFL